jgi:hypothetical protein
MVRMALARRQGVRGRCRPGFRGHRAHVDVVSWPCRKRFPEHALAHRALLHGQDGAPIVGEDRNIEPGAFLQQLDVAALIGRRGGQTNLEISGCDLDGEAGERRPAAPLTCFRQDSGHVCDASGPKTLGQLEHDVDDVAGRAGWIGVPAELPGHAHGAIGNLDVGPHHELWGLAGTGRFHFGAPDHGTHHARALRVVGILFIQDGARGDGNDIDIAR